MGWETFLYKALEIGVPMVVEKVGERVWKQLLPPIQKARQSAVEKMAEELGPSFPTEAFLRLNFRFDSQIMQNELGKLLSGRKPDEDVMKQEMVNELSGFPQFSDKADEIVECFLKYFEIECLGSEELKGFALASIIREEATATQQLIKEVSASQNDSLEVIISKLNKIESVQAQISSNSEKVTPKVITALGERFIEARDSLIDSIKTWRSAGLYEKIKKLAEDVFEVRKDMDPVISGSIFRLFGSFLLRSKEDHDGAMHWIGLAEEVESSNPKNTALKAELLCSQGNWKKAKQILEPFVESSEEPLVKIIYAESLAHTTDVTTAYHWLKSNGNPEQDDMKLNLAIFAVKADEHDYALDIINDLKKKPFPGPYPYLLTAEILAKQAHSKELITISTPEDIELQKNYALLNEAIGNLTSCVELMKTAARPPKEMAYIAQNISELSLMVGDSSKAEKYLCQFWKQLRHIQGAWFTAASVAAQKGKKGKALYRAQRALEISKERAKDPIFRFALLCLSIEEWDKCLEAVNAVNDSGLDEEHLRALIQMRLVCYFQKKDFENAEKEVSLLRDRFPRDEMWVIHKALMLKQIGKTDEAVGLLAEESRKFPESIKIKIRLAAFYKEKRMYAEAIPLYKAIAASMKSANAFEMACNVAFEANEPNEVLSIIEEADKAVVHSEDLTHFKAFALTMNKQYDEALSLFSEFSEGSLKHNDYIFYAICYANRANPQKAISILSKAKDKYPEDIRIPKSLYRLYLEVNDPEKAFKEASIVLEADPEDKAAYFAVMQTGFASGEDEEASKALSSYLSRFGEGPELRVGKIDDLKELIKVSSERTEFTWRKYQDGLLPEITLSQDHALGVGGYRLMLLESGERVMAFSGTPDSQIKQRLDTLSNTEVLLDYHSLITIHHLSLFKETLALFGNVCIPEVILSNIREDLFKLSTSYQRDRRLIEDAVFLKAKHQFHVHTEFPKIPIKDIPESIGNAIYDLHVCRELNCAYVTPGFESRELSDVNNLFRDTTLLSVLDIVDIMKDKGIISIHKHADSIDLLKKYKLERLNKLESSLRRLMFDWSALQMLEECDVLDELQRLSDQRYIGPFSYAILKSDVNRYQNIDKIQKTLKSIEEIIAEFIENGKIRLIPSVTKKSTYDPLEYIEEINKICKEGHYLLWTDDLALNGIASSEGIKTTGTRTVLDVLLSKGIILEDAFLHNVIQLLKWNMHFCWINYDIIFKYAEMYDYSMSEDLRVCIKALSDEIKNMPDHLPNSIEQSNFNVASIVIQKLWQVSDKSRSSGMKIFDELLDVVKLKGHLRVFWISKCIIDMASWGELPLADFLKMLSIRMTGQIYDEFKGILRGLITNGLSKRSDSLFQRDQNLTIMANIIKAVKVAIPGYRDELISFALKRDPSIRVLLKGKSDKLGDNIVIRVSFHLFLFCRKMVK